MFKWFAPLLLFAGKPEVLIRIVAAAIAGAVLFFGVYLLSNIALTFDALKNPYIIAAYGIVLLCFFVGVGAITWLRLRRGASSPMLDPPRHVPEAPPLANEIVSQRAEQIAGKWQRGDGRPPPPVKEIARAASTTTTPAEQARARPPARASLMVTGPAYTGKTALIAILAQAGASAFATSDIVRLIDAGPIDGDDQHLEALITSAAASDGVLFVVDQDLRAPEVAAITRLIATGKPLWVVLNKADQFNAADRDAILISIRAKMPVTFAPGHVVSVAGAPSPVEREIEDARGAVRVELRRPSSDVRSLTGLLNRVFPPVAGRMLRFEAE